MSVFLMPICARGHEHFWEETAPAADAGRAAGQVLHAVPIAGLNVPLAQARQSPLLPRLPGPHVATHGRSVSGPPLGPGS
jgi:hypothetical protein